jgi:hypothetical protein
MAKACKDVFMYFYIKQVIFYQVIIHLNVKQFEGSRCLLLRITLECDSWLI